MTTNGAARERPTVGLLQLQRRTGVLLTTSAIAGLFVLSAPFSHSTVLAGAPGKISCSKNYDVGAGDYWYGIARKVGVSMTALLEANAATATTPLYPGDVICLPDFATPPTTAPTTTLPATTVPTTAPTTAPTTTGSASAAPTGSGTIVALGAFPTQGPCTFGDTFGAPRSGGRLHDGVDIIAKVGQFVYAVTDGTLTKQTVDKPGSLSGNAWWLTSADKTYYFYAHLGAFAPGLKVGSKVVAGQIIGYVGATGNAGGPHLHFEVHPGGGAPINPTASAKAVDGCKNKDALAQPGGIAPVTYAAITGTTTSTSTPAPTATASTAPASPAPVVANPPTNAALLPPGGGWQFISPVNAFDSGRSGKRLVAGTTQTVRVDGLDGVEPTTSAVMLRLTASGASSRGFLVVHRCDRPVPTAVSLSFPSAASAVGTSVVAVSSGTICVTASTTVNLRLAVIAYATPNGVGLQPISAVRALDTRTTTRLTKGSTVKIDLSALGWVPGTQAVSTTITLVGPSSAGALSIGFCGTGPWTVPVSGDALSSFSFAMRVSTAGWCLTSTMSVDVVVDVTGLWVGSGGLAPVDGARVYDSRALGVKVGPTPVWIQIAGQGGVPANAVRAVLSISDVAGPAAGLVFAGPCDAGRSVGVVSAGTPNRITTAVVPVMLGAGAICVSALDPVDLIIDVVAAG